MALATLGKQAGQVESIVHTVPYHHDPLSIMEQLCSKNKPALLLESAEIDSKDNLKSLLMVGAALKIECWKNRVEIEALSPNGQSLLPLIKAAFESSCELIETSHSVSIIVPPRPENLDEDARLKALSVFDVLRVFSTHLKPIRTIDNAVFLGGVFGYDVFATYETLPDVETKENTCPDYLFYLAESLIIFDHQEKTAVISGSVFSGENVAENYFAVSQHVDNLRQTLTNLSVPQHQVPQHKNVKASQKNETVNVDKSDEEFKQDVLTLKENILAGDIFQVVPSRTFSLTCPEPRQAYRCLKQQNPSPYMFYLQTPEFTLFGASPESALKYTKASNEVEVYPIAGTRPRGKNSDGSPNPDLDSRLELALREDHKEKAEHIMLVDLARNDVAKVSQPGTRYVKDLLNVDRYSHVMHLVSRVVGQLRNDVDALHAYQACMNMGTLVGAPKVSAASLIRKIEKKRRGSYGGAVGYINDTGDMDTCIVIRSAFVKNDIAYIQAGAGVVYDSDPQAEADETRGKAQAVISAIQLANTMVQAKKPESNEVMK
jgi:anthranilate synthase component 1